MSRIGNTSVPQSNQANDTSNAPAEQNQPDSNSVEDFKKLLHAKSHDNSRDLKQSLLSKENSQQSSLSDADLSEASSQDSMPNPSSLYSSLFSQNLQANNESIQVETPTTSSLDADTLQDVANRILVATKSDGSEEVKITINDKMLAGTEVTINKSLDGMLTVRFDTNNANSFQTLVASQDILKSALESQNSNVRIEVSHESQEGNNEQGQEHGSRGKLDYINPEEE